MLNDGLQLVAESGLKIGVSGVVDVDVETAGRHNRAVLIQDGVADDDDLTNFSGGRADAVTAAEGRRGLLEQPLDLREVVGMFVAQHQFGGRLDGAGFVAVDASDSI